MIFSTWLRNWKRSLDRRYALQQTLRRRPGARRPASRPRLEVLEDRCLLSPYVVYNGAGNADPGTLIYAIEQVNAGKYNEIDFQIGATGSAQTINLTQPLPALTASNVYINGLSQGGSGNTTQLITLNGANDTASPNLGIALDGSNCTVSGLILEGFNASNSSNIGIGIAIDGNNETIGGTTPGAGNVLVENQFGIQDSGSGTQIQGNYIGTDTAGSGALGNSFGIEVSGNNVTIGGAASAARNIISGNSNDGVLIRNMEETTSGSGNLVLGNFIGVNAAGKAALANETGIQVSSNSNTIGGTAAAARNLISGNSQDGVLIGTSSSGNQVLGNYIGTDLTGATATGTDGKPLGNDAGVEVGGFSNTVGGAASGAGNVISGNSESGVLLDGSSSDNQVLGNFIGANAAGSAALANDIGINVQGGTNNSVGGTVAGAGNLISGNDSDGVYIASGGTGNQVLGNSIGVNAGGKAALANGIGIEVKGAANTVGGTVAAASNLISGNRHDGVLIDGAGSGNRVLGNSIGVDPTASLALANSGNGIEVRGAGNTIGGAVAGAANLISGNSADGVLISGSGNQVLGNYLGTTADGNGHLPNSVGVAASGDGNTIGGTVSGASNLISGNSADGVLISGSGNQVLGNYIGTTADGKVQLANSTGVYVLGAGNTIGGTVSGASNLISGNSQDGVLLAGSSNQVLGNYIGTDAAGATAVANSVGIEISSSSNSVGGTVSGASNFISGNSADGVLIDKSANGTTVQGNSIGLNVSGAALDNGGYGVNIAGNNNSIGGSTAAAGNSITSNTMGGVLLAAGSGNSIRQNSLFANGSTNTGPGISLSTGANNNLAAPSLSSVTLSDTTLIIKGTFTPPTANVPYVLDFYANPSGDPEGKVYLDSTTMTLTSTGTQPFTFTTTAPAAGTNPLITASLTDATGNTSAFSNGLTSDFQVSNPPTSNSPTNSSPNSPPTSSTPALSPLQETLEVAFDTAAFLMQSNVTAFLELEGLSELLLRQSLPASSELLSTILSALSAPDGAGLVGVQLGLSLAGNM